MSVTRGRAARPAPRAAHAKALRKTGQAVAAAGRRRWQRRQRRRQRVQGRQPRRRHVLILRVPMCKLKLAPAGTTPAGDRPATARATTSTTMTACAALAAEGRGQNKQCAGAPLQAPPPSIPAGRRRAAVAAPHLARGGGAQAPDPAPRVASQKTKVGRTPSRLRPRPRPAGAAHPNDPPPSPPPPEIHRRRPAPSQTVPGL